MDANSRWADLSLRVPGADRWTGLWIYTVVDLFLKCLLMAAVTFLSLNITDLCFFYLFFLKALFDSMIGSQIPGDPFMSQRILSSSSLPLRQRSDKPPWCECATFLIGVNDSGGKEVKDGKCWKPGVGVQGFYALPSKKQKQKGKIAKRGSSRVSCEKVPKRDAN